MYNGDDSPGINKYVKILYAHLGEIQDSRGRGRPRLTPYDFIVLL